MLTQGIPQTSPLLRKAADPEIYQVIDHHRYGNHARAS